MSQAITGQYGSAFGTARRSDGSETDGSKAAGRERGCRERGKTGEGERVADQ